MYPAPITEPRTSPTQLRAIRSVERLLDATGEVLVAEGYDRASTNKIAARAGMSVGTLYRYFPTKEAVVLALARRHAERELTVLGKCLHGLAEAPLEEAARELIRALIDLHRIEPDLQKVFLTQIPQIGGLTQIREMDGEAARLLERFLAARIGARADLGLVVFVLMHAIEGLIHQALLQREAYLDDPRFAEELTRMAIGYLTADVGRRTADGGADNRKTDVGRQTSDVGADNRKLDVGRQTSDVGTDNRKTDVGRQTSDVGADT
jgi:AcrR family transcriptional regulator